MRKGVRKWRNGQEGKRCVNWNIKTERGELLKFNEKKIIIQRWDKGSENNKQI